MKPLRILQIISGLEQGSGVAQVVLNWHRNIDTTKVQFDYLCFKTGDTDLENEVRQKGSNVYCIPYKGIAHSFSFIKQSIIFFKEHRYQILHSHITHLNLIFYPLAKIFGVKHIIQHAHLTTWSDKKISAIRNYLMLHVVWPLITHKIGCSQAAGKAYFGKNFMVVNNGIDTEKFVYNSYVRASKRKELGLENNFVIGHIGRFNLQKNHKFLIEIFKKVVKKDVSARLVLIGSGPLESEIRTFIKKKNLQDKVIFLGVRKDIPGLLQAVDCFVFPSLFEGLGIVAIEAQAACVPCVLADTLPDEAFICNYKKLPLGSAEKWAEETLLFRNFKREDTSKKILDAGFSSKDIAKQMEDFYKRINK